MFFNGAAALPGGLPTSRSLVSRLHASGFAQKTPARRPAAGWKARPHEKPSGIGRFRLPSSVIKASFSILLI